MRPLEGVTVVSLEHAIAAPFCTRHLADLGARVIKVERLGAGDFAREYDEIMPLSGALKRALLEAGRSRVASMRYLYDCIHLSLTDYIYRGSLPNKP